MSPRLQPGSGGASRLDSLPGLGLFEIDFEPADSRNDLMRRIRWILGSRFLVAPAVLLLMLFTGWQGWTRQPELTTSSVIAIGVTGAIATLLNGAYYVALRRDMNLRAFVFLQLVVDVVLFTSYIYRSGGITSPFAFLYLMPIIAAAMLVSARAAVALAALSSLAYSLVALMAVTGFVEHISYFVALDRFARKWSYVVLLLLVNSFAYFAVATLAGMLMGTVHRKHEALRETTIKLDRRAQLLDMLYRVARSAVELPETRQVIEHIGTILRRGLELDRVLLYLVDGSGERLVLERVFVDPGLGSPPGESSLAVEIPLSEDAGLTARCALSGEPINVTDPANHPAINAALAARIGLNPFALAPLVAQGEVLGVLGVDRKAKLGVIDEDAFQVLVAFADQAAGVLHRARTTGEDGLAEGVSLPGSSA